MLEPRLEVFAQELALGRTEADAYRAMTPNTKAKDESIWAMASKIANDLKVKLRVLELQVEAKEKFLISAVQKKMWLKQIIERSLQIEEVINKDGESVGEYKFQGGDAIRAINELNKMDGDHAPTKQEHGGKIELSHEERLKQLT